MPKTEHIPRMTLKRALRMIRARKESIGKDAHYDNIEMRHGAERALTAIYVDIDTDIRAYLWQQHRKQAKRKLHAKLD